jgi:tetratricopeptide (TPR) repeat protein
LGSIAQGAESASAQTNDAIRIVELRGLVEVLPRGATHWVLTQTSQALFPFDRIHTRANSSVALLLPDQSVLRFDALSEVEILPDTAGGGQGLHLIDGIFSFFHRGRPGRVHVISSGGVAGVEGTEFVMALRATRGVQQTTLSVVDGKVRFSNAGIALTLTNGEQAAGEPGLAPRRTPGFIAQSILQWCFYYPGVLDLKDLPLTPAETSQLAGSLTNYRAGDLNAALTNYPDARQPGSDAERVYHAALLVSAGQVEAAEADLSALTESGAVERNQRLAAALRLLIAAVKRWPQPSAPNPKLATELLAASYYAQSRAGPKALDEALALARQAVAASPDFGFGWERVAELEFSFGRTDRALDALNRAGRLSPRNAQGLALRGFLLAAQNRTPQAIAQFDRALGADSALGNAWLGRGLCRIRLGDGQGGREDLLVAAAMEPRRAALRSYLGKALGDAGDDRRARHELALARGLDPDDPSAWLYSALLNEQDNRINDAIDDLEKSQAVNDNRAVYRSGLLLDQDRAVRSANLARIYDEAGMPDVAFREAAAAVNSDYENYSAHLFLANSYDQLADPNLVNLRFEPAETTEYLLANLLSPVGAGTLSPAISQEEYSKLFEQDGLHLTSTTEYLSRGAWLESAAQYGTFGNTSYSLEAGYRTDPGQWVNDDIQEHTESISVKRQLTPHDSVFLQAGWLSTEGGDLEQRYDPNTTDPFYRTQESQDGSLIVGYHHQWRPGVDTLLLAARVPDRTSLSDPLSQTLAFDPVVKVADPISLIEQYQSTLTMYLLEAQQLVRYNDQQETIAGIKFAYGNLQVDNTETVPSGSALSGNGFPVPGQPVSEEDLSSFIERLDAYLYHRWEIVDGLWLQGGVSYNWVMLPENFLFAPISNEQTTRDQLGPKAGMVWTPFKDTTVRVAAVRSLTGASFEQSIGLEPSQIAGFTQGYREVVPETAAGGPTPATPFDTGGLALDQKFGTGTYLGISGQLIHSSFDRELGGYALGFDPVNSMYSVQGPAGAQEHLNYNEKSLTLTANQLVGRDFSLGVKYQLTRSDLEQQLTGVQNTPEPLLNGPSSVSSLLGQLNLSATWNHPSGVFAQFTALWSRQNNVGYSPAEPGDNFWQLNVFAGYRFPRRQAQISIGILNLTDRDYRLEPLTFYNELPRTRTLVVQATFSF